MSKTQDHSGRIDFIDGLRGLAMLLVLGYHHWGFAGFAEWRLGTVRLPNPFAHGHLGVHLFLVISGFCLAWPYSGPAGKSVDQLYLGRFLWRRFVRLAPAYYAILALSAVPVLLSAVAKTGTIAGPYWQDLLAHLFWVHNLNGDYLGGFNMVLWTLALEAQLYLLFPLFLLFRNSFGLAPLALLVMILELLYRAAVLPLLSWGDWTMTYSIAYAVPGRMFEFVAGIVVAGMIRGMPECIGSARVRWVGIILWAGSGWGAFQLAATYGEYYPGVDVLWGLFFGITVFLGFLLAGWRRVLENPLLMQCGICAYSVYLIHHPVGLWLHHHFYFEENIPEYIRLTVVLLYPLLMVGAGWLCYRALEEPFMKSKTAVSP